MVSFPQVSPPEPCTPLSPAPYAPHTAPISFFSILPPAQYSVRSTDHWALDYVIFSHSPVTSSLYCISLLILLNLSALHDVTYSVRQEVLKLCQEIRQISIDYLRLLSIILLSITIDCNHNNASDQRSPQRTSVRMSSDCYFCNILTKIEIVRQLSRSPGIEFHNKLPRGSGVVPCGRTDKQTFWS